MSATAVTEALAVKLLPLGIVTVSGEPLGFKVTLKDGVNGIVLMMCRMSADVKVSGMLLLPVVKVKDFEKPEPSESVAAPVSPVVLVKLRVMVIETS